MQIMNYIFIPKTYSGKFTILKVIDAESLYFFFFFFFFFLGGGGHSVLSLHNKHNQTDDTKALMQLWIPV